MATYVKGDAVANATSYELYKKSGSNYTLLDTKTAINFEVSALGLTAGDHVLVVKAKASGYNDSDYSNTVTFTVEGGDELITGLYTDQDVYLAARTDKDGNTVYVPIYSDTNSGRIFVCELEDGATYNYSYTNSDNSETWRTIICTYAPSMSELKIATLGFGTSDVVDPSVISCPVDVVHTATSKTEGSYSGTFTNSNNAKTLIMMVGWKADAAKLTASVKKV